jgi:hypothetical protein
LKVTRKDFKTSFKRIVRSIRKSNRPSKLFKDAFEASPLMSFLDPAPHIRKSGLGAPPVLKSAWGVEFGFHSFAIWQGSPLRELWLLDSATRRCPWWRKSKKFEKIKKNSKKSKKSRKFKKIQKIKKTIVTLQKNSENSKKMQKTQKIQENYRDPSKNSENPKNSRKL